MEGGRLIGSPTSKNNKSLQCQNFRFFFLNILYILRKHLLLLFSVELNADYFMMDSSLLWCSSVHNVSVEWLRNTWMGSLSQGIPSVSYYTEVYDCFVGCLDISTLETTLNDFIG